MKHKKIDFKNLLKGYQKGWVAISADFKRVLFYGKTLESVQEKSKKSKEKVYFFPSGENYSGYIG